MTYYCKLRDCVVLVFNLEAGMSYKLNANNILLRFNIYKIYSNNWNHFNNTTYSKWMLKKNLTKYNYYNSNLNGVILVGNMKDSIENWY